MIIENYVAFDVETPNYHNDCMCSIGIVSVIGGFIEEKRHYLINPECHFDVGNIRIHGITPHMVADAPTFSELWPEIRPFFDGTILVAHNAGFDIGILQKNLERYGLYAPRFPYYDTVMLARKAFPEAGRHNLKAMSMFLDIDLINHHNALDDAICCQGIFEKAQRRLQDISKDLRIFKRIPGKPLDPLLHRNISYELKLILRDPQLENLRQWHDQYEMYIDAYPFSDALWKVERILEEGQLSSEDALILKKYVQA